MQNFYKLKEKSVSILIKIITMFFPNTEVINMSTTKKIKTI